MVVRALSWLENHTGVSQARSQQILGDTLKTTTQNLVSQTVGFVGGAIGLIVQGFFVIITMYYLFRDGERVQDAIGKFLPLQKSQSKALFARTREVIEASVYGVLTVATVQGTLGGLAFWFLGLPSALLWGVVMTLLSVIPMAGSWLVWIPAVAYLLATGHWIKAIALLAWGALVVGTVDNFLRPKLVGKRAHLHELLVFFSVIGGLKVFGFLGLILGPVVLAITIALLEATKASGNSQERGDG